LQRRLDILVGWFFEPDAMRGSRFFHLFRVFSLPAGGPTILAWVLLLFPVYPGIIHRSR
jgi:hypothetical protein